MSDSVTGVSVHTEAQETAGGRTAGTLLREARMEAGLHIAALAVALKVPVAKLEALESDNFAVLPDTVFVRALASSVCRTLKIDPAPILALLPQSKSPRLAGNAGINAPVKGSSSSAGNGSFAPASSGGKKSWAIAVVVLALLAGALAIMFVPADRNPFGGSAGDEAPASPPVAAQEPQAPVAVASGPAAVPAPASAVVAAPAATPAAPVPAASPSAAAVAGAATPAVAASTPEAAASASSVLTLSARGASWVQVRDAGGTIALQKNLAVGESVAVSGTLPLAVVIGRADVTDVFVRGKPFALTTVSRDNVARFEVK